MADPINPLYVKILDACRAQSPDPLYPKPFAIAENLNRGELDPAFDFLRLNGLVRLTDWVQGLGQGYALTEEGGETLQNPVLLERPAPAPQPAQPRIGFEHGESTWQRGEAIRNCLIQPVRPIVTRALLIANLAVFGFGWYLASQNEIGEAYLTGMQSREPMVPGKKSLGQLYDSMGALEPSYVEIGQWWRLLSYAFLHGGLLHIALNMYFLFNIGSLVESLWGSWRYLILYVVGALAGGLGAYLVNQGAVGASGALCGLLLSMVVWLYMSRAHLPQELVMRWQSNLMTNILLLVIISFLPGVSWAGHLGGAVGGAAVAFGLYLHRFWPSPQRWLGLGIMVLTPALVLAVPYMRYSEPRDYVRNYYRPYEALDTELTDFLEAYGTTIVKKGPQSLGEDLPRAKKDIDRIVKGFQDLTNRLKATKFEAPNLKASATVLFITLEIQKSLGVAYQKALAHPEKWNEAMKKEILDQVGFYYNSSDPIVKKSAPP